MKRFFYSYTSSTDFLLPVNNHSFILRCQPVDNLFQTVRESHLVIPDCFWHNESTDGFGNRIVYGGMADWHKGFSYQSSGIVELDDYRINEVHPSKIYGAATCENVLQRVEELCFTVFDNMQYCPGATSVATTAEEAWQMRRGVCQDFAHILIYLCRKEGIAARYVCGIIAGEGKTHAWVEVWSNGAWYGFDPTHNCRIDSGYLKIAHGRNAADCSVNRGTYCGQTEETTIVSAILQEI